ncbi:hypothetical protein LC040_07735 [Bacillus tianshenii]|nr:hypothetical protein LC040_07735 [Bacillus tianshenii]
MAKNKREKKQQAPAPKRLLAEEFGNEFMEANASKNFQEDDRKAEKR